MYTSTLYLYRIHSNGVLLKNAHSFIKSWFFGMQQFSFNPAGIFSLKDTLKIYKGKKTAKSASPRSGLSLNPLFKKECHLLSDKLESMEIKTPSGFNDKPLGYIVISRQLNHSIRLPSGIANLLYFSVCLYEDSKKEIVSVNCDYL